MKDSEELQISTGNIFKELPENVSLSPKIIDITNLTLPQGLFDPETPLPEGDLLDSFLPVIVRPDNNTFTIIDGCKRYLRHTKNKQSKISCNVIQTKLDNYTSGLLRIAFNRSRSRPLREKILFLSWLQNNCIKETFEPTAQNAGFSPKDIELMTPILSCDAHIKEALFNGSLDISLVTHFQVLTREDQTCFLKVFKNMKLSLQTQREFLEWLPEIAYNENTTVCEILSETQITTILEDAKLNDPQRIQKIHSYLYEKKFPRLSDARNIWKKQAAALNPDPSCVTFVPNPYFEKNLLEIKISVTNSRGAATIFKKLANVSPGEWQTLIYPLSNR